MRRLLLRTLLLVAPFALVAAGVAWLDPFRCLPWGAGRPPDDAEIASRMNPPLWQLAAYRRHPTRDILLGDSRMASLETALIDSLTGARFTNLGYGGGSLDEAIKTFWFADRLAPLGSATFGINLSLYNQSNNKDRVTGAAQILASPALYLCDRLVLRACGYQIAKALTGRKPAIGVPPMSRDEFWRYQLEVTGRIAYEHYRHPEDYRRRLAEIAEHCRVKHIALRIVVFPEHDDLARVAARYGLVGAGANMRRELAAIGETVDLAGRVDCADRSLFTDPFHFNPAIEAQLVRYLWGGVATTRPSTSSSTAASRSTIAPGR